MANPQDIFLNDLKRPAAWFVTPGGQEVLARAFREGTRPRCACREGGIAMYIGRRGRGYYLARMPGTGFLHAPDCPSALSGEDILTGVGYYAPGAVRARDDGCYVLNHAHRIPPFAGGDVVSIEGLLDFILEIGDINAWDGETSAARRSWSEIRPRLVSGAGQIRLNDSSPLFDGLLIPYPFDQESADDQETRFRTFLNHEGCCRYVLAPVKKVVRTPYGWGLFLKHLARFQFWFSDRLAQLWQPAHAVDLSRPPDAMLCLALVKPSGKDGKSFSILDLALRRLDARMMPSAGPIADDVAGRFVVERRAFTKPLRFDAPLAAPLADYVLRGPDGLTPILLTVPEDHPESVAARVSLATQYSHADSAVAVFNGRAWRALPSAPEHNDGAQRP